MFVRYQHVEHIDSERVKGLLDGRCYVFPKLDGENTSVYMEDGEVVCASRNKPTDRDHAFYQYVLRTPGIKRLLEDHPDIRLYGEFMRPQTIKTYRDDVWNNWFVFDVCVDAKKYRDRKNNISDEGRFHIPYMKYMHLLDDYGIPYIEPIASLDSPSVETLQDIADNHNSAYIKEGMGSGEGIVVKRYDFVNADGETVWGKVLNSVYRDNKAFHATFDKEKATVEELIAHKAVTPLLVDKEYNKILSRKGSVTPNEILNVVWYCVVTECLFDEIRRRKDPVINFALLKDAVFANVKQCKPELFQRSQ